MKSTKTNKKAVIYCRVSTREQVDEGNSLITQEKACKVYALKNGYEVAQTFIEQGESAKTANRTELQKLLQFCAHRKNQIDFVITYKLDRISRNIDDYSAIRIALKKCGIEIKSTTEFFENTPAGKFMENIIANVAQFDNDVRTERSINGMKEAMREQGRYVWGAPVGYRNSRLYGKSNIVPSDHAPLVKKVFERVALNSDPLDTIRIEMFKEGLMNRNGKLFTKSYFYKMLKNKVYCGWILKFGEKHRGTFEPIISEDLFEAVQHVLQSRKKKILVYQSEHPDFPLRRFIKHSEGFQLTGGWSQGRRKRYAYYRFTNCKVNIQKTVLEHQFKSFLSQFQVHERFYDVLKQLFQKHLIKRYEDNHQKKSELTGYIDQLKNRKQLLIDRNLEGVIPNSILTEQLDIIQKEMHNSQQLLQAFKSESISIDHICHLGFQYLTNIASLWENASFKQKIFLQWFTFPKGVIFNGKEFTTPETCNVFKVNSFFLNNQCPKVPLRNSILNNPEVANVARKDPWSKKYIMPPEPEQILEDPFWNRVINELMHLASTCFPAGNNEIN